jgi:NADPH2:quinone reductase
MKAIRVTQYGEADVLKLQDIDKPKPEPSQALVRIEAAGLNFIDIYQRRGRYPVPLPYTLGLEASGVVEAIGESVRDVRVGDRVAYSSALGSYAEYNVVEGWQLIPLPRELPFEEGAAFPLQGMTAHYLLTEFHCPKKGETVLVHAAAGGVGLLLVQWLRHLGARVIGTVSTEEKASAARQAGAHDLILYSKQDFAEETKRLTDGKGADYIIDGVGKTTFPKNFEAIKRHGHIVIYGSASGPADPIAPNMLQRGSFTVSGGSLSDFVLSREEILRRANDVFEGFREGWLKLKIEKVLPLAEAAEAHRLLEGRHSSGKMVLKVR